MSNERESGEMERKQAACASIYVVFDAKYMRNSEIIDPKIPLVKERINLQRS
jgi:hypothetical protein